MAKVQFDHEAFYDEHIAPALLDLAQKCAALEIPFLALVQFSRSAEGKGQYGETAVRLDLSAALAAASSARHQTDPTRHVSGIAMLFRDTGRGVE